MTTASSPRRLAALFAVFFFFAAAAWAQSRTIAERLGFPRDAKLLIIHGDDLAVAHSVDAASFKALDQHAATSASIMVPCPWLTEVAGYFKQHPDSDLGLHLTLTSEWLTYRWPLLLSAAQAPSLYDARTGYPWPDDAIAAEHITPADAEREIRAQVERAAAMGIRPTHLDSHQGTLFYTPELFAAYVKVAHESRLPFLVTRDTWPEEKRSGMLKLLAPDDLVLDAVYQANPSVRPGEWKQWYEQVLQKLPAGSVSQLIVHIGFDDAELQAITAGHEGWGSEWRQRDYDTITSADFQQQLKKYGVTQIGWKDLKKLLVTR